MENGDSPSGVLYSPGQIALAAFLGGPAAAGWFLSRNFRQLEDPRTGRKWLVGSIVGTLALLACAWFLPENFPTQALPVGYTIGFYQIAKNLQAGDVSYHLSEGGRKGSWWTVAWISLLFLAAFLGLLFAVVYSVPEEWL